ncbi:MAG: hypothetical protein CVU39_17510 [Chloroflexi bacterium HGW-Chloroflexi-10]|nr:MAG: hypothetical protein CVU39_17510 [Chloroflexi bacterium HGW-Chloroflexi-10]
MPQRTKIILNPITNHGRSQQDADQLKPMFKEHAVDWYVSEYAGHSVKLAHDAAAEGYDLVVAAGGDGTVHEVVNGLMQLPAEIRPKMGILPLGSGNDFAHIIGVAEDHAQAFQNFLHRTPISLDVGVVGDENNRKEYFCNTIGIGFDAVVTIHTKRMKKIHGFMMYLVATVKTIFLDFPRMDLTVETDEERWEETTIMLTLGNGPREGGGFMVTPDAKVDDGLLNYVTVSKISRLMMLRLVPEVMKGTQGRFRQVRMGICRRMSIHSKQPLFAHCDGEIFSGFDTRLFQFNIEILPNALQVIK